MMGILIEEQKLSILVCGHASQIIAADFCVLNLKYGLSEEKSGDFPELKGEHRKSKLRNPRNIGTVASDWLASIVYTRNEGN